MGKYQGLIAESTSFVGYQGFTVEAFLARPLGPGPFPGVVVTHHIRGWDRFIKGSACRLATEGFAVLSPNFFAREAPNATPDDASMAVKQQGGVPDSQAVGDTESAVSLLRHLPYTNGKIGIIGWCLGGRQAYLTACQVPVDATVDIYGGSISSQFEGGRFCLAEADVIHAKHPVLPLTLTDGLSGPILLLTGSVDRAISPEMLQATIAELARCGKAFTSHVYEGVGHEYMNPYTTEYRIEATEDSWQRSVTFLRQHLSS